MEGGEKLKLMKNLIVAFIAGLVLLVGASPVLATQEEPKIDECGSQVEYTRNSDFSDNRVVIDFINTASNGNPDSIAVSAQVANGYALVSVLLDIENDNLGGYQDHTASFPGTFNPNPGEDVDSVKVTVVKVCGEICADNTASNYEEPVEGQTTANNELCVYPQPEPPVATPSATPNPPAELPKTGIESGLGGQLLLSLGIAIMLSSLGTGMWLALRKKD